MAIGHINPLWEEVTVMREVMKLALPDPSLFTLPFMTRLVPIHKGTKENGSHKIFLVFFQLTMKHLQRKTLKGLTVYSRVMYHLG